MKCLYPNMINSKGQFRPFNQKNLTFDIGSFMIPCQHCFNCKINKSKMWAVRCLFESYVHNYNYFITLTYDDEHLNFKDNNLIDLTGEIRTCPTLVKSDVQKFIKRLRKKGYQFKYFLSGEYGDKTKRPHYHMLMFSDTKINDLVYLSKNKDNDFYFNSNQIRSIWKHGNIVIANFSPKTAAYTARYTLKKLYGDEKKSLMEFRSLEPEFMLCSKKPPIGWTYFYENKDNFLKTDTLVYWQDAKLQKLKIPNSFLLKFNNLDVEQIKFKRKKAAQVSFNNFLKVNKELDYLKLLLNEQYISFEKQKKLKQTIF